MTKTMIGLGILSIPFVFMAVGLVPGIIVIIVIQVSLTSAA
jgi:amino acid permease